MSGIFVVDYDFIRIFDKRFAERRESRCRYVNVEIYQPSDNQEDAQKRVVTTSRQEAVDQAFTPLTGVGLLRYELWRVFHDLRSTVTQARPPFSDGGVGL